MQERLPGPEANFQKRRWCEPCPGEHPVRPVGHLVTNPQHPPRRRRKTSPRPRRLWARGDGLGGGRCSVHLDGGGQEGVFASNAVTRPRSPPPRCHRKASLEHSWDVMPPSSEGPDTSRPAPLQGAYPLTAWAFPPSGVAPCPLTHSTLSPCRRTPQRRGPPWGAALVLRPVPPLCWSGGQGAPRCAAPRRPSNGVPACRRTCGVRPALG